MTSHPPTHPPPPQDELHVLQSVEKEMSHEANVTNGLSCFNHAWERERPQVGLPPRVDSKSLVP